MENVVSSEEEVTLVVPTVNVINTMDSAQVIEFVDENKAFFVETEVEQVDATEPGEFASKFRTTQLMKQSVLYVINWNNCRD